jgi:hypothetical protein
VWNDPIAFRPYDEVVELIGAEPPIGALLLESGLIQSFVMVSLLSVSPRQIKPGPLHRATPRHDDKKLV